MSVKVFAKTVEQEVHDQLKQLMSVNVFKDAKVRIMPDTHAGKGCVIGFTADLGDKVVPNLVGVDVGCFTKDTKVKLADGRDVSFEDLIKESEEGKEHYGYSFNCDGRVVISKLDLPRKIKEVDELVEITLDNGEVIHSTLDHIFYDVSRNEIEAKDLTAGTSLFPCYIDVAKNHIDDLESGKLNGKLKDSQAEYNVVFQPISHKWSLCHYLADDYNERHSSDLLTGSYVRHHVDFNKHNNNPTNIQRVTYKDHWKIHADNVSTTNKLGISGFSKAAESNHNLFSEAGKKRAESIWHGKNAEQNRVNVRKRIYEMNASGKLNSEEQRERARQRQLTSNTTKFAEQNKDPFLKNKKKLSKLRKILTYCNNDFSKESYNNARQSVYNAFTYDKALEIIEENNTTFEELCNYKNHKVVSVKIIKEHVDVYCLTCFEYGNFALSSGVFVHNCGMYVVNMGKLDLSNDRLAELDKFIRDNIPSGMSANDAAHVICFEDLDKLYMRRELRNIEHLHASVGSLGGGNHFIELNKSESGNVYLVIHTGSRNLGQQVCRYYQAMAVDDCNNVHKVDVEKIIAELKAEGRQKEIAKIIAELKATHKAVPDDLCYLEGAHREAYLHDMRICQEYALRNREEIAKRILGFLKVIPVEAFHTVHNYIDFEDNIIRKGAIRCNEGEKVVIPLNMRDGSIIGIGKGNEDWNCSGPHGAGRLMSRSKARQSVSMEDFKSAMGGIFTTSVNESTLDESPMAYKDANEIVELVKDTIDIIEVIKPIYNFKNST